jgi:hypothetical protein
LENVKEFLAPVTDYLDEHLLAGTLLSLLGMVVFACLYLYALYLVNLLFFVTSGILMILSWLIFMYSFGNMD